MVTSSPLAHIPRVSQPPVYRLPPEILSMIFLDFQYTEGALLVPYLDDAPHRTPWQESMGAPAWTDVLFVCRFWCDVALGCSSLWARVVDPSVKWAEVCLRRSAGIPLTLRLNAEEEDEDAECVSAGAVFSEGIHRVRKLSVKVQGVDAYMDLIDSLMCEPAPLLEYLCIDKSVVDVLPAYGELDDDPQIKLSPLFEGHTPRLRKLRIQAGYFFFPLDAPMFRSVTFLRISMGGGYGTEKLLFALENWKQLQTLSLSYALPGENDPDTGDLLPAPTHRVELPNLRHLRVVDSGSCTQRFLRHLAVPSSALLDVCSSVSLRTGDPFQEEPHVAPFIEDLLSSIPSNIMDPMTSLHLHPQNTSFIIDARPELWDEKTDASMLAQRWDPDEDDDCDDTADCPFKTKLNIDICLSHAYILNYDLDSNEKELCRSMTCPGYFKALFAGQHFSGLRDLTLDGCFTYSVHTWAEVFKTLNGLEQLSMTAAEQHTADELVKTLGVQVSRDGVDGCLILPTLANLTLSQPARLSTSAQENLLMVLRSRHLYSGSRLAKLRVSGMEDFEEAILTELRYHTAFFY
ncbi:hypothetical protein EVG20_g8501 [Dentipellis fragilis]|uniref:Uncharacterized protein n=1 Tax=Dentipellis fragilis TaxID=205917 RepID=A0A4Y9Y9P6_9AGAM|nr:hypothetical protein EVG20_g8501 [Dentipellis fragilis]